MIQVLESTPRWYEQMGHGLGASLYQGAQSALEAKLKSQGALAQREQEFKLLQKLYPEMFGEENVAAGNAEMAQNGSSPMRGNTPSPSLGSNIDKKKRAAITSTLFPEVGKAIQAQEKEERREFESDRSYHGEHLKDFTKQMQGLRESLPRKKNALKFARQAVESGDVGQFSMNRLADFVGGPIGDAMRTAKGAQLVTAGKENLLSNMARVNAKAQNQWFEQRLNSMFPKVGQSKEANLTVQEMLEGEVALDDAYLNMYDKLAAEDEAKYGYERKDLDRRVHKAVEPLEDEILKRTTFRMKELEEKEKDPAILYKQVGKNVEDGTPLTLTMARLYTKKYGSISNAVKAAKKNGYYIPTEEEAKSYQSTLDNFLKTFQ